MREELECSIDAFNAHAVRDNIPLSVLFELTYRCNLFCVHCYQVDRDSEELSFSEVADIIDQLAAENCLFLTLSGGEVFAREDFFDIARYAVKKGFALKVFSNGTLINEGVAHELAGLRPLEVGVSIYGSDAATHDQFTSVPGSFNRSVNALKLLKRQGVLTVVKCLLMKENMNQIGGIKALANEVGAILQFDPIVAPKNDGNRDPLQHELSDTDLHRFFALEIAEPNKAKEPNPWLSESIICRAGRDLCCISPRGDIYPCVALPVTLGNLRKQSFAEIWRGVEAERLRKLTPSDLHECVSCPDLGYCTRCWGLAAVESRDYLGPSKINCRIARIRHRISVERAENKIEMR